MKYRQRSMRSTFIRLGLSAVAIAAMTACRGDEDQIPNEATATPVTSPSIPTPTPSQLNAVMPGSTLEPCKPLVSKSEWDEEAGVPIESLDVLIADAFIKYPDGGFAQRCTYKNYYPRVAYCEERSGKPAPEGGSPALLTTYNEEYGENGEVVYSRNTGLISCPVLNADGTTDYFTYEIPEVEKKLITYSGEVDEQGIGIGVESSR